jgi:hypothetical protein
MYKHYSKYKAIDFIQDDFFIDSIRRLTNRVNCFGKS